jgi:SAM-dependent methyltransferase
MTEPCGCTNVPDAEWGVLRNVRKCPRHKRKMGRGGRAYYTELGATLDGIPQHREYVRQFIEPMAALGVTIPRIEGGTALEIGCGLGMYAPMFLNRGYAYHAIEADAYAVRWVASAFCCPVFHGRFEDYEPPKPFDAIMAAHVVEHLTDAPGSLDAMLRMLYPGGRLYLVLPDDSDRVNADHLWFFTEATLRATLERIGFEDIRMTSRRLIERENFIYCAAVKP